MRVNTFLFTPVVLFIFFHQLLTTFLICFDLILRNKLAQMAIIGYVPSLSPGSLRFLSFLPFQSKGKNAQKKRNKFSNLQYLWTWKEKIGRATALISTLIAAKLDGTQWVCVRIKNGNWTLCFLHFIAFKQSAKFKSHLAKMLQQHIP